ncbi:hypothetical protein P0136_02660 [Lentisphaerota bacterium ZTH]|nr:hypothetical protein JYG24_06200 [Lentisphaerota bacterium]WET06903.1 hypothetical protein P0136_02660 [Lentisphaerota bacterium ZTH]
MLKKLVFTAAIVFSLFALNVSAEDTAAKAVVKSAPSGFDRTRPHKLTETMHSIARTAVFYLPNRLMDAADIISFEGGFGGVFALEMQATRYLQIGGAHGSSYFMAKAYDRQCGGGYRDTSRFGLICWDRDVTYVSENFGSIREYVIDSPQFSIADCRLDAFRDNEVDFWAVGVHIGWLLELGVAVHPIEVADFAAGIFCIDLRGDDIK